MRHYPSCTGDSSCFCEIRRYAIVLAYAVAILVMQVIGGIYSGSLALIADAGHVLSDASNIVVAIGVALLVRSGHGEGIRRFGGYVQVTLLFAVALWILYESVRRFIDPQEIESVTMIVVASLGAVGNYLQHRELHRAEESHITHRALSVHVLTDLFQSIGVILGGIVILTTGWAFIDPLVSLVIAFALLRWSLQTLVALATGTEDGTHHHH